MDAEKATFPITRMAGLLGVSRSGFYQWRRRRGGLPGPAQQRRAALTEKIIGFHAASDHVYGSPRILADLREDGERVSAKTVAKLMRTNGIVGISPRKFVPVTTVAGPDPQPIPDLTNRRFDRGRVLPGLVVARPLAPNSRREPDPGPAPARLSRSRGCANGAPVTEGTVPYTPPPFSGHLHNHGISPRRVPVRSLARCVSYTMLTRWYTVSGSTYLWGPTGWLHGRGGRCKKRRSTLSLPPSNDAQD